MSLLLVIMYFSLPRDTALLMFVCTNISFHFRHVRNTHFDAFPMDGDSKMCLLLFNNVDVFFVVVFFDGFERILTGNSILKKSIAYYKVLLLLFYNITVTYP